LTCFKFHKKRHYANQFQEKKNGKRQQSQEKLVESEKTVVGVDVLASKVETPFFVVYFLSINTIFIVGWYVDTGASSYMTFDSKIFDEFQEQDANMEVELGDDTTYPMIVMGFVSLRVPSDGALELNGVLFVLGLMKNLLFIQLSQISNV
jgi:hypothetical protein